MAAEVTPFRIDIADDALVDLRRRIDATRWPNSGVQTGWSHGTDETYLRSLVQYWRDGFDWRTHERRLNAVPQFLVRVDDQLVHLYHARSERSDAIPLLMCHGWPGGNIEFVNLVTPLTAPPDGSAPAFHVVAPSMPGYGFSSVPTGSGMHHERIATLWFELMTALGYERFGIQGGDWGAWVALAMSRLDPPRVTGMHLNYVPARYLPAPGDDGKAPTAEERAYLERRARWIDQENGYGHIQGTKPQTLAYGLSDSPVGLAAWIVEKFYAWSDARGDVESAISRDELLTNISIYWFTNTIASSVRLYKEAHQLLEERPASRNTSYGSVPTAVASFPSEIAYPPREHLQKFLNIIRWTQMPRGGHFAALEQPDLLMADVRAFFGTIAREAL